MTDEREKCLELFGLKPGASAQEIKAAYRDLAKVWHPDRFSHDPRLQEKAQNKLKEINEAYEVLTSARNFNRQPRAAHSATETTAAPASPNSPPIGGGKQLRAMMTMILIICAVAVGFFVSLRFLQQRDSEMKRASADGQPARVEESMKEGTSQRQERKSVEKGKAPAAATATNANPVAAPAAAPLRPLPIATVTIDPLTGLLATTACPNKNSMTYPAGQEPQRYCSADHRSTAEAETPPKSKNKSRLKAVANRLAAPARWLHDKTKEAANP